MLNRAIGMIAMVVLLAQAGWAPAQTIGPGMSPIVTWDPDRGMISRPPTRRPLTAAETKLARARAEAFWDAFKRTRAFSQPGDRSTHLDAWAVINEHGLVELSLNAVWSAPSDTRQHRDGAWYGVMGGVHDLLYMDTNVSLPPHHIEDPRTRGNFGRDAADGTRYFAMPRQFGEIGGGTIYLRVIVFTRDGRSALAPAPLGPLLDIEIARLSRTIADSDKVAAGALQQLEASMTPEAVSQRRAKREAAWSRETRDPAAMAKRLDAAHRTDEWDYQRRKEGLTQKGPRDPMSSYWAPRMALEKAQAQRAALADPATPACARIDPAFGNQTSYHVHYEAAGAADCVPMMQVRRDLLDRRRPLDEVQVFIVHWGDNLCGERWDKAGPPAHGNACPRFVPTLKDLDWPAIRQTLGW